MKLDTGWQQALLAQIHTVAAADPRVIAVQAFGSVASGEADAWSDLDVTLRVVAGAATAIASPRWLAQFGQVWAVDASANSARCVVRAVYADGRRLDVSVADAGRTPVATPPALDRLAARTTRVRFAAALAVEKAARNDLLIASHLTLGVLRDCLEVALLLRDRTHRTSHHRFGGPGNDVSARAVALLAGGADPASLYRAIEGAVALYDGLAGTLQAAHVPDRSGLDALLDRARADLTRNAGRCVAAPTT